MDCRKRILAVLNGEIPDRVPITEFSMDSKIIAQYYHGKLALGLNLSRWKWLEKIPGWRKVAAKGLTNPNTYKTGAKTLTDLYKKMELDLMPAVISMMPIHNWDRPEMHPIIMPHINEFVDEYGRIMRIIPTKYGFETPYYVDGWINSEERYKQWGVPNPHHPVRAAIYEYSKDATKQPDGSHIPFAIPAMGGISESTWEGMGMVFFAKCLKRRRDFIAQVLDDRKSLCIELIKDMAKHGAEAILIYDDYGFKTGPLMNPKDFQELFAPRMKEIVDIAHDRKIKVILHSCGNLNSIFDQIVNFGIDAINPLEPTAYMDLIALKKTYPNLTFIGNVSPQDLQDKDPAFIRAYTTKLMTEAKTGGRFILASGHSINPAVNLENYLMMRKAHKEMCEYK